MKENLEGKIQLPQYKSIFMQDNAATIQITCCLPSICHMEKRDKFNPRLTLYTFLPWILKGESYKDFITLTTPDHDNLWNGIHTQGSEIRVLCLDNQCSYHQLLHSKETFIHIYFSNIISIQRFLAPSPTFVGFTRGFQFILYCISELTRDRFPITSSINCYALNVLQYLQYYTVIESFK